MSYTTKRHGTELEQQPVEGVRDKAEEGLLQRVVAGNLTLGDYAGRAAAIEEAATSDEVDAVLEEVPANGVPASPVRPPRWLISAFGGSYRPGRWRLGKRLWVVALLGAFNMDLGMAQLDSFESVITVVGLFGGAAIFAPPRVSIRISGFSLFGRRFDTRVAGPPLPNSPVVHVRAFPIFGKIAVKDRTFEPRMRQVTALSRSHRE